MKQTFLPRENKVILQAAVLKKSNFAGNWNKRLMRIGHERGLTNFELSAIKEVLLNLSSFSICSFEPNLYLPSPPPLSPLPFSLPFPLFTLCPSDSFRTLTEDQFPQVFLSLFVFLYPFPPRACNPSQKGLFLTRMSFYHTAYRPEVIRNAILLHLGYIPIYVLVLLARKNHFIYISYKVGLEENDEKQVHFRTRLYSLAQCNFSYRFPTPYSTLGLHSSSMKRSKRQS